MLTMEEAEDLIARWEEADDELRADFLLNVIGRIDPTGDATHEWANNFEQDYVTGIEGGAVLAWGRDVGPHREFKIVRRADHSPGPLTDDEIKGTIRAMSARGDRLTIRGVTAVLKDFAGVTPSASRVQAFLRQHRGEQTAGRDPVTALRAQDAHAKKAQRQGQKAAAKRKEASREQEIRSALEALTGEIEQAILLGQAAAVDGGDPLPVTVLCRAWQADKDAGRPTLRERLTETLARLVRA